MTVVLVFFIVVYFVVLIPFVGIGFAIHFAKRKNIPDERKIPLDTLSVVVPFRNEANNLPSLMKSITQQSHLPLEFIFVNDHSEDNSASLIERFNAHTDFQILELPDGELGKKAALRRGIQHAKGSWILTLDADVELDTLYFTNIANLSQSHMHILPVLFKVKNTFQRIMELDVLLVNAINIAASGWKKPFIASGANLIFEKQAFLTWSHLEKHQHISSGDDVFLLHDFINAKANVITHSDKKMAVWTHLPSNVDDFFSQRLRWLSKTPYVKDFLSKAVALGQLLLNMTFVAIAVIFCFKNVYTHLVLLMLCKTLIDILVFYPYFKTIGKMKTWALLPLYELLFPIYNISILLALFLYKPKWKGRDLLVKYEEGTTTN